ncbi:hypothetical protein J1G43_08935 [Cellulomonas sp. zg-ZUI22]|uniref:hypothetical protein n=1 Tax=Cellulomonas sp. zg-ZUI22 TaxID=2816955 RepID=UPI001A9524C6|nr:hypothetical protein [Cellulomonas sp. zg-ZUI22]MBO0900085.1 hypothetical protein [Cellulomonas sp. zg-ZUI22]
MDTAAPPPDDVTRLLQAHGTRAAGAVGTDGAWWVARPVADDGAWLAVQVADVPVDATLAARARALTGLHHPHLARVVAVEPLGPGRVALVCAHVPGPTLTAVRAARHPLTDGEVVTVAVPVAQALAHLHGAGIAHGAVGADRIVLGPGGMPVLVDLRAALRGDGTATGDVHRLLATLLGVMPPIDAHLAAGLPEEVRLRDALEALLRTGAGPDEVVDTVFALAAPEPVHLPDEPLRDGPGAGDDGSRRPPDEEPVRRLRQGRRPRRRPSVAAVATAAGLLVLGAAVVLGRGVLSGVAAPAVESPGQVVRATAASRDAAADREDPAGAAAALTRWRGAALAAADPAALTTVAADGSPALAADRELVDRLAGARSDGLVVDVVATAVTGTTPDGDATVVVTSAVGAHTRVTPDGQRAEVAATAPRTVELVLRWTAQGWRVWDVREPAAATP